jgi:hypothetical protein
MSKQKKIYKFSTLDRVVKHLRDDFISGDRDFVLIFAHNGTGKTRLSTEFKRKGKKIDKNQRVIERDTLYFNAFTEDLFSWDNDLEHDREPRLLVNSNSHFIDGFRDLDFKESIEKYFQKYCSAQFEIIRYTADEVAEMADPSSSLHYLYRRFGSEAEARPKYIQFKSKDGENWIKISRGEERIFVWCVFLAIFNQVLKNESAYRWVKHIYIDDPVSSLDDNNVISVACDLASLLHKAKDRSEVKAVSSEVTAIENSDQKVPLKIILSSHHALFFNVIFNELKSAKCKSYFLHRLIENSKYTLQSTDETPFFHHVALLSELISVAKSESEAIYGYHFNMLRSILEKTATFFGKNIFTDCIESATDKDLFARALNLRSHGGHSLFEPTKMSEDDRALLWRILKDFTTKFQFDTPDILERPIKKKAGVATA